MDKIEVRDGVTYRLRDGEWVREAGDTQYRRETPDHEPTDRAPAVETGALPAEARDVALRTAAIRADRWVPFPHPASGEPTSPEEYAEALALVQAGARAMREEWGDDYLDARHAHDADAALAVMVLTPKHLRRPLGMPETWAEFDREWGFTRPWAYARQKSKAFEREHLRDGAGTARTRGALANKLIDSLARKLDADADTSGHANLAAKLAGLVGDTAKDEFEGTAREGAVREMTPEQKAASMIEDLMATPAAQVEVRKQGDNPVRSFLLAVVADMLGGRKDPQARKEAQKKMLAEAQAGSAYEPAPAFDDLEEATFVEVE